jgi:phenylalanyl-tRNA synthetase beta chain
MKASVRKVNGVLGITIPDEDIIRILSGLQMEPVLNGDELTIKIPPYREDMEAYPDIAEELIRMYGYDHVKPTFLDSARVTSGGRSVRQKAELEIRKMLCGLGAYECMHYSFFSPSDLDLLRLPEDAPERKTIRILNPINEELSLMRTTLAAQMIAAVSRNQKKAIL